MAPEPTLPARVSWVSAPMRAGKSMRFAYAFITRTHYRTTSHVPEARRLLSTPEGSIGESDPRKHDGCFIQV
jgi:hypothetical protein